MEEDRFPSSRDNPRALGLYSDRPPRAAAGDRLSPPILDRFRAMLRDREEELRALGEEEPPPPTAEEVVRLYEEVLSELTFNSKPIITELTIIAGEQRECGQGIAEAICARILEVPVDQKLPSLYLLDSIVKNIGCEYVRYFADRLPQVFCLAYNQVHSSLHPAMRHLFGTWAHVFPSAVLRAIEDELQFSTPDHKQPSALTNTGRSESPARPSHGIHINPKYLEARRHLEHSPVDHQNAKGASPSLEAFGQKSSVYHGENDFDHPDVVPSQQVLARRGSQTATMHEASAVKVEGGIATSKITGLRPSPPPRVGLKSISPSGNRLKREISPVRFVEGAHSSNSGKSFVPDKVNEQNNRLDRSWPSDYAAQHPEDFTTYSFNRQRTRELIDAYGNYRGKSTFEEKLPKVPHLEVNGPSSDVASRSWQNTEEEEYVWEDMSPTFADQSRRNSLQPFVRSAGPLNTRASLNRRNATYAESDFSLANWTNHTHLPPVEDPTFKFEDRLPIDQSSRHVQDPWKMPYSTTKLVMPPAISGREISVCHKTPEAELPFQRLPSLHSDSFSVSISTTEKHLKKRPHSPPPPPVIWPVVNKCQPLASHPLYPHEKQFHRQFDVVQANNRILNQGPNPLLLLPLQHYDAARRKALDGEKLQDLHYQHSVSINPSQSHQLQREGVVLQPQESHGNLICSQPIQFPSHLVPQVQGMGALGTVLSNSLSGILSSHATPKMPDNSIQAHGIAVPPLPPGPPPASLQMGSAVNSGSIAPISSAGSYTQLISTLMEKGWITLQPTASIQAPSQDSVGVEFNHDLLKIRHESAINSLYDDLSRQCLTCGMRFTCQDDHRNHMDWHVTKNRISKNRKQKPSRKWFVSAKEWLSGAETLGTDFVPGFLPKETVTEKKEDKELAVPADENQKVCALCAEPFEEFYSDETEEWMYRGAVYLNAPDGYGEGLERSQSGPIIHAKCRPESSKGFQGA